MLSSQPTPSERRASLRFPIFRPVRYALGGREQLGLTQDLSAGGLRLISAFALPLGSWPDLTIPQGALSLRQEAIRVQGRVAWSDQNAVGIEFVDPGGSLAARLAVFFEDYLDHADAREIDVYLRQNRDVQ